MADKTKKRAASKTQADLPAENPTIPEPKPWWPDEFASPLKAICAGAFVLLWSVLLFVAGSLDALQWVKRLLLIILGVFEPVQLAAQISSWDAAAVLWAFGVFCAATVVHPVLALAFLMLVRPWLDAYTYPTDNIYFTWALMPLFLLLKQAVTPRIPFYLLTAFFVGIVLSVPGSLHYDKSFTQAVFWAGHLALFGVVLSLARNPRLFAVLLFAFFVTVATEILYAIPHFKLLLPHIRKTLMEDPSWLLQNFGSAEMSPELAHRFNVNRAFGNMLFPNALAGFYILAMPPLIAIAYLGVLRFRDAWSSAVIMPGNLSRRYRAIALAGVVWLICTTTCFLEAMFASALGDPALTVWYESVYAIIIFSALVGFVSALAVFFLTKRGDLRLAIVGIWAGGAVLMLPFMAYSLLTTYSRGAFLALAVAMFIGLIVFWAPTQFAPKKLRRILGIAPIALLLFVAVPFMLGADAGSGAPEPPQHTAAAGVMERGVDLSMGDLASTSTFKLRLSYWRVGLRILGDFWLRGTGMGAFEMAYPAYQHIGDGEVREAHNSILQMFIETGILGGIFFALFWGYVLLTGLRHILSTKEWQERLFLSGIFAGILAFLGHSLLDIHFSHHGLVFYVLIVAGLFVARTSGTLDKSEDLKTVRWRKLLAFGFCAVVSGLGLQFFLHDFAINRGSFIDLANTRDLDFRIQVANYFLTDVNRARWEKREQPLRISYGATQSLIPNQEDIEYFARIFVPVEGSKGMRQLTPGEAAPINAVVQIERPGRAAFMGVKYAQYWVANWERLDASFPHDARLALAISGVYQSLGGINMPKHPNLRAESLDAAVLWAQKALERNPRSVELNSVLSTVIWMRAKMVSGPDRVAEMRRAISITEKALALAPMNLDTPYQLAWQLDNFGDYLAGLNSADPEIAQARKRAEAVRNAVAMQINAQVEMKKQEHIKKFGINP